jgi:hypothetical protein
MILFGYSLPTPYAKVRGLLIEIHVAFSSGIVLMFNVRGVYLDEEKSIACFVVTRKVSQGKIISVKRASN